MDTLASPLMVTKLRVPALRPRTLPRAHLIEQLAPEAGTRLILVCAPAGCGKTTLLAEWSHSLLERGVAVAWYALDAGDDRPGTFAAYLVASLEQALGPLPALAHLGQLVRSSPELDPQQFLPAVVNAIAASDRECVLILDDYQHLHAPAIHALIAFLLERLSDNLRLALGSRSDPPLPLARLRGRGQLLEVRTDSLRFTSEETTRFLNESMKLGVSPGGAAALEARIEGWVAGLQLAALSLSSRSNPEELIASFTGSHRYLVEYLLDEVVNRQPEEVQSFLLATSVLERMCGPLCAALVGEAGASEARLAYLEQANLFVVALDEQATWYRYHHLFRDFLRARLDKTQPERAGALHRAASEWLAQHGSLREAAAHAFQTGDWEYAAAFVEQHGFTLIIRGEFSTLYEWCSAFPEAVMQRRPLLCIDQCWPWAFAFGRQNRDRAEHRLQQAEQAIGALEDPQQARELRESIGVVRTFLLMAPDPAADPRQPLARSQQILAGYPEDHPGRFTGLLTAGYACLALQDVPTAQQALEAARRIALREGWYAGVVESTFHLARLAHAQGHLRRAAEISRQGQADIAAMLARPEPELPAAGCLDVALGEVLLEQDHLEAAEHHLRQGLERLGGGLIAHYLMTAYLALFRLYEILDRPAEALTFLDHLEAVWPDITFCTQGLRMAHALRTAPQAPDALVAASAWVHSFASSSGDDAPLPGLGPFGAAEVYYRASLAWARAQIALRQGRAAGSYLLRQRKRAEAHGLRDRVIELSLLEALAWHAERDQERTWEALARALRAAQPEGYVRSFDQGPALTGLLLEAAQHGIGGDALRGILAGVRTRNAPDTRPAGGTSQPGAAYLDFGECLSEREVEVLRLMAQGASNQEIAERLVITVGTVKSHINHILGKLEAHNRTEAVARARALGLLEI